MRVWTTLVAAVCVVGSIVDGAMGAPEADPKNDGPTATLEWRCVGPARGGRVQAVAGVPGDPRTYYMGATGGGVWKTENAGASWDNITDGQIGTGSVGSIAVAPSDPNVVYLGMGEADVRGNLSHGDGVYRSVDAGKTWTYVGLEDTRHIGRIMVDPRDEDTVFVAALGHIFGPNAQRGVFKSTDGGKTWERVLYVNDRTGAIDLAIDPNNPRNIFAAMWQVHRRPWELSSGGEGSGLWRSRDGGETWEEITKGLPKGVKGKIGVTVSPARRDRVWALVEADKGGVFRSDDGGDSWRKVNSDRSLRQRAWYYTHIYADPQEADTVYVLNVGMHKSTDGGSEFGRVRTPHGDNHDLWIAPEDNQRMIEGNDGGANVTFDAGRTWSTQTNQPTAQFYHVTTDTNYPYRLYGAQQDNSTISVSSRARPQRWQGDAYDVGGGESGYIAVRPDNPDIVYAGSYMGYLTRYDHGTGQTRNIMVWPENTIGWGAADVDYRFQWTFPIILSPHDPEVVYVGANVVFESVDSGASWQPISPDLTTNDKSKQQASGGPITKDNTGVEYYCTVFTIAESPLRKRMIWAGSDDGLVHVTTDGGERWDDVTPKGMGDWPMISMVEASPHNPEKAYLAVTRYKMDDFTPIIYRTKDAGKTWDLITDGIPSDAFVRCVREDPVREGLLFAGTELGVYCSRDDGAHWEPLQLDLPVVPVTDLVIKDQDLVIATQGRSFWILDDISPLRQWTRDVEHEEVHLFEPAPVYRVGRDQVRVNYRLGAGVEGPVEIAFLDRAGKVVRSFGRKGKGRADAGRDGDGDEEDEEEGWGWRGPAQGGKVAAKEGMNKFEWNMRYEDPARVPGAVGWPGTPPGPMVAPGRYTVRLTVGDQVKEAPLEIRADPRVDTPAEAYEVQVAMLLEARDLLNEVNEGINTIRSVRNELDDTVRRYKKATQGQKPDDAPASIATQGEAHHDHNGANGATPLGEDLPEPSPDLSPESEGSSALPGEAKRIKQALTEIEEALIQTKSKSPQDPLNYPVMLNDKLAALIFTVESSYEPTEPSRRVLEKLASIAHERLAALDALLKDDVAAFNSLAIELRVPAVVVPADEDDEGPGAEDEDVGAKP